MEEDLPADLNQLIKYLRKKIESHRKAGGDWRSVMNALRVHVPAIWPQASLSDKQRFLRHALPYWNIHRHRVNQQIANLLAQKTVNGQLNVIGGRLLEVENGMAVIKTRYSGKLERIQIKWLINCMGPSLTVALQQPLIAALLQRRMVAIDPLGLGLVTSPHGAVQNVQGKYSSAFYALGPLRKGMVWESSAVPEIRKQSFNLAKHILNNA